MPVMFFIVSCGGRRPGRQSQCIARSAGLRTAGRLDTRFGYPRGAERPEQRIGCPRRSRCDCRYDRTFGGRRNPAHGSDPKCTGNVLQFDMDEHIRFLLSLFGRCLGLEHAGTDVSAGSGGEYPAGTGGWRYRCTAMMSGNEDCLLIIDYPYVGAIMWRKV